jgi:hypothetical protein
VKSWLWSPTQNSAIPRRPIMNRRDRWLGGSSIRRSRTANRHPDGTDFIERVLTTYKEEAVWPYDF